MEECDAEIMETSKAQVAKMDDTRFSFGISPTLFLVELDKCLANEETRFVADRLHLPSPLKWLLPSFQSRKRRGGRTMPSPESLPDRNSPMCIDDLAAERGTLWTKRRR